MFFDPKEKWQVATRPIFVVRLDLVGGEKRFVLVDTIEAVPPEGIK